MKVVIIGSGNVAAVMGRLMHAAGHEIEQVWSRQEAHAASLAQLLGAAAVTDLKGLKPGADLYLLAVSDTGLESIAQQLRLHNELIVHTAGAVSKEVLKPVSSRYGVLWPMKMIRKSMQTIDPVTMVVDGNTTATLESIEKIAGIFTNGIITRAGDATRERMHLLAAITSNFTNHLYHLAADYCAAEQIDFSLFCPIIADTARQVQSFHPKNVQAGPAFRNDTSTLHKHEALLKDYPSLRKVYEALSESIRHQFDHANH